MLTRVRRSTGFTAAVFVAVTAALLPAVPAAAAGNGDPDHWCVANPSHARCLDWIDEHGPVDDPGEPVCTHAGAYVPCRSPIDPFDEGPGWWIGDLVVGVHDWARVYRDNARRIDDPDAGGEGPSYGCWGWLQERTGGDTGLDSPSEDPDQPGAWYRALCLGPDPWDENNPPEWITLPGFYGEVGGWRPTGSGPSGDPIQAALNARADLDLTAPTAVTAPPESGAVPLGMPVWLAVAEDESGWGPLTGSGCDGSLCVTIETRVHSVQWQLGNGDTRQCARSQNRVWQLGMDFLDPVGEGACHYYYDTPSRELADGHYDVEVTATWHTYWEAEALGLSGGPLEHTETSSTTVQVQEVQVLTGRPPDPL